ncbi:MAG: mercury transporter MerT [Rhizobiales bacterium]|nr:mercury transporter MerT [Hyphomicrobiales bacterium]
MIEKVLAGGGLAAAVGASTCCVLPLSFTALGLSGIWLSTLAVLAPYRIAFSIAAILLLGAGFWLVYATRGGLTEGAACAAASPRRATKGALWAGAGITAAVLSSGWWQQWIV